MKKGFTLIELLIIVAIFAILVAIAVPNILQAQSRSRVARAQNDLRSISLAMESYYVDNKSYPPTQDISWLHPSTLSHMALQHLTTPVAYLPLVPKDVFRYLAAMEDRDYRVYAVGTNPSGSASYSNFPMTSWMSWSLGPDLFSNTRGYIKLETLLANEAKGEAGAYGTDAQGVKVGTGAGNGDGLRYDPTNGTVSYGDIYRFEGKSGQK